MHKTILPTESAAALLTLESWKDFADTVLDRTTASGIYSSVRVSKSTLTHFRTIYTEAVRYIRRAIDLCTANPGSLRLGTTDSEHRSPTIPGGEMGVYLRDGVNLGPREQCMSNILSNH